MTEKKVQEISLPDGSKVQAAEVDFSVVEENWDTYQLEDGSHLRLKHSVARVFRVYDDEGNPRFNALGDPEYVILYGLADDHHQLDVDATIKKFEVEFSMSSAEFLSKWSVGGMPDTFETNYWASLLKQQSVK